MQALSQDVSNAKSLKEKACFMWFAKIQDINKDKGKKNYENFRS